MTTATASRSRFGYHQAGSAPTLMKSSTSSPDLLLKSASRDIHLLQSSSYKDRSSELDDAETTSAALSRSFEFGLDPNFWNEHNVQVIIRVRPLSGSELSIQGDTRCVRQESTQAITWTGHPESRFTFDIMADENVSQEILFKVSGVPMVENCMEGYNSCMFAYGQVNFAYDVRTVMLSIQSMLGEPNINLTLKKQAVILWANQEGYWKMVGKFYKPFVY